MIFSVNGVGFVGGTILEKLPWDGNFLSWGKEYRKMGMIRLSNNMREESARQRDQGLQKFSSRHESGAEMWLVWNEGRELYGIRF